MFLLVSSPSSFIVSLSLLPFYLFFSRSVSLSLSLSLLSSRRQCDWVIQWFVLLITELRGTRYNGSVESTKSGMNSSGTPDITENEGTASPRGKHARTGVVLRSFPVRCTRRTTLLFPALRYAGRQESIFSSLSRDLPPYFFLTPASCYCCHRCRAGVIFLMEKKYRLYVLRETYLSLPSACKGADKGFCPLPAILVSGERFSAELI